MSTMLAFLAKISILCFAASYGVAFALELWHLLRPRPILRYIALGFGIAGLLAHVAYLPMQSVELGAPQGSMFLLALILAVFYVGEAIHHQRVAWAIFVLPIVLGLIGLGLLVPERSESTAKGWQAFWGMTHGTLLIMAAVGVSVGFIASIMYLVQLRRLQAKLPPNHGLGLFNLERLEQMNRRAILWSFPLLTAGLLAGFALQAYQETLAQAWDSPRVLSVVGLWLVVGILLFLRYRVHVRGRQVAIITMIAFAILVVALVYSHPSFAEGAG